MIRIHRIELAVLTWLVLLYVACSSKNIYTGVDDSSTGSASDADTDADTDSDSVTDTDSDSDSDSDGDTGSEYVDNDSDGWISEFDCDDDNPDANPGKEEIYEPPNNVDEDCDGLTDERPSNPELGGGIPSTCKEAEAVPSSIGCKFFGVDLDQWEGSEPYAISVANVQTDSDVKVIIETKENGIWVEAAPEQTIAPLDLISVTLPQLRQQKTGILAGGAYRITTDVPVAAYQFNPLDVHSRTTDASMLYPVSALDTENEVVQKVFGYFSYFTVAAAYDGTVVEIIPTDIIQSGTDIPRTLVGETLTLSLDEGDIAQVRGSFNIDYTGTKVRSSSGHPIAVFSGHPCIYIGGYGACDHIEEQVSGLRRWGKNHVAASLPVRDPAPHPPEPMEWTIYASIDNTQITIIAPDEVTGIPDSPLTLNQGEKIEFSSAGTRLVPGDFRVEATEPIALFGFMTGWSILKGSNRGDPLMVQYPSTEQFLPRYVVLIPMTFPVDHAVITRPAGVEVRIDGLPVDDSEFNNVGDGWEVGRILVDDGVHDLESDEPFGVVIIGVNRADSYGYVGGIGTKEINPHVR